MDESRKQFEEYLLSISSKDICFDYLLVRSDNGDYVISRTNDRWLFWQASREVMK